MELIRQGQKDIQDNQVKILERVGAVETELNSLKTEVDSVKESHKNVKNKVDMVERNFQAMNFELTRLEQYSRKSLIHIYGIREEEGEKVTEKVVKAVKEEIGSEINAEEIDITHRAGKKHQDRSRGILVKVISHKSKVNVMKKKKQAKNICITKDLSVGTRKMLNDIYTKKNAIGMEKAWITDGKIKYKLIDSDQVLEIQSTNDFFKLMDKVMDQ